MTTACSHMNIVVLLGSPPINAGQASSLACTAPQWLAALLAKVAIDSKGYVFGTFLSSLPIKSALTSSLNSKQVLHEHCGTAIAEHVSMS